jgi:Na+-translocating ferredoxin:NAD+ oxidoreductase RNF subunit RnfB
MAETNPSDLEQLFGTTKEHLSLESLQKVENLLKSINGMNCAACGSPDCRTFSEDVVMGRAALRDCLLIWARENGGDTSSS